MTRAQISRHKSVRFRFKASWFISRLIGNFSVTMSFKPRYIQRFSLNTVNWTLVNCGIDQDSTLDEDVLAYICKKLHGHNGLICYFKIQIGNQLFTVTKTFCTVVDFTAHSYRTVCGSLCRKKYGLGEHLQDSIFCTIII